MRIWPAIFAVSMLFMPVGYKAFAADSLVVASANIGSSDTPVIIAKQLGYFKDTGLDVTIFDAGGGNNAVSSVIGGSAQIALVSVFNASKPAAKGQPLKIIGVDTQGFGQYLFVRSALLKGSKVAEASTLADKAKFLQNKTIAVNDIGGSSGAFARQILAAGGLTGRDAKIININSPGARLTALKIGRIDAIIGSPPEPETAIVGGYGTMLVNPLKDLPSIGRIASSVEVVRADFLEKNSAVLLRYEAAVQRGRKLIQTNPTAARDAYYAYISSDARSSLLNPQIEARAWDDMLPTFAATPVLEPTQYASAQTFFHIPESLTFEIFVDNSLAQQVVQ
jgi:ABC-type nitrate/sulfonate/bicarbonate transport system substrate-binding protein